MTPDQLRAERLCERANAVAAASGWSPLTIWSRPLVSTLRLTFADYVVDVTVDANDSDVAALERCVVLLESDCFRELESSADQLRAEIVSMTTAHGFNEKLVVRIAAKVSTGNFTIAEATADNELEALQRLHTVVKEACDADS